MGLLRGHPGPGSKRGWGDAGAEVVLNGTLPGRLLPGRTPIRDLPARPPTRPCPGGAASPSLARMSEQTPPEPLPAPSYPLLEAFVETIPAEEAATVFADVREALEGLKGPRAEQARKVRVALDTADELIQLLLNVRSELEAEKGGRGGGR